MGMSHDFETAIEEGATLVRVGTAIFGGRSYAPRFVILVGQKEKRRVGLFRKTGTARTET